VRHILDHVADLCNVAPAGRLSYDRRKRGTAVEVDPGVALQTIAQLQSSLHWQERCEDGVAILLSAVGCQMPHAFGLAPSTPRPAHT